MAKQPEHNNDFLRLNGSDDWIESFVSNFVAQVKDPTRFRLFKITPNNNLKAMAKQENAPKTVDEQEPNRFRYHPSAIDWEQVGKHGINKEQLEKMGVLDEMMRGYKSGKLVTVAGEMGGVRTSYQARVSFRQQNDGSVILQTHPLRQAPDFTRPFLGHNFSEDDKINLLETGNMGRVVPLRTRDGFEDCFVSRDKLTNEIVSARVSGAYIGDEYSGVKLTDHEKNELREGRPVRIEGMTSKAGKEFDATLQYSADRRGVEYIFEKNLRLEYGQELGKVKLTNRQVDDYNAGKAIFVEHMVSRNGEQFSSFVKRDDAAGRASYSRINPDNPAEIYVPIEINGVKVSPEEREQLRRGDTIFLNNMVSSRGEEFSAWVKLNPDTAYPMTSRDRDDFSTQERVKIPQEIRGVTLSATQRAELQDSKSVKIEGMKGAGGDTYSQWAKLNANGTKLNFYNSDPDARREIKHAPAQKNSRKI